MSTAPSGDRDVHLELFIGAEPRTVWDFWVDPARLVEWWGTSAQLEPRSGGRYRVVMGDGPVMSGTYVELVPYERLVFLFGWEGGEPIPPNGSRVEVTLRPQGDGTLLTLRHTELPPGATDAHRQGWTHFLDVLSTVVQAPRRS